MLEQEGDTSASGHPGPSPAEGGAPARRRRRRGPRSRRPRRGGGGSGGDGGKVPSAARRLGISRLRPEQSQVITDTLDGRDVLMVVPTGFGKSACYQIPSMVMPKPVLVISPLRALLRDQQLKLEQRGVPCVRLDGTLRGRRRTEALAGIAAGSPTLVMTTPETLDTADAREALTRSGVSLIAVDEAHCMSEWGHDFRPAYLRLGQRLRELGSPPLLALTATATSRVRDAIVSSLRMRDPLIVASSPHRSNLAFEVMACEGDERARAFVRLAKRLRRPGIVYSATRREVDLTYTLLRRFNIPAYRYHGGMTAAERNAAQERFMRRGQRSVMVATNAFGLGIDKPDIRYVLHFQAPAALEQYVQEAGRGGRDGHKSNCILLYDPADRSIHEALLARSRVRPEQLFKLGKALAAWAGESRSPSVEALALSAELGPRVASALLAKLEEAGLVTWEESEIHVTQPAETIEEQARALAGQFETLRTQDGRRLDALAEYARSTTCRATFLRGYFGEEAEAPCGLCDLCRGSPGRPETFFEPLKAPPKPKRRPRGRGKKSGKSTGRTSRPGRSGRRGGRGRRRPRSGSSD